MTSGHSEPPGDLDARLRALRQQVEPDGGAAAGPGGPPRGASGMAYRMSVELAAGLVVGGGIGWLLDSWLHTTPAMIIVFFILGAAAGILNVYRTAMAINRAGQAGGNGDGAAGKTAGASEAEGSDRGRRP